MPNPGSFANDVVITLESSTMSSSSRKDFRMIHGCFVPNNSDQRVPQLSLEHSLQLEVEVAIKVCSEVNKHEENASSLFPISQLTRTHASSDGSAYEKPFISPGTPAMCAC